MNVKQLKHLLYITDEDKKVLVKKGNAFYEAKKVTEDLTSIWFE